MVKQLVIIARLFRAGPEDGAVDANLTDKQQQPAVLTDGSTCFTDLMCKTVEQMSGSRVQHVHTGANLSFRVGVLKNRVWRLLREKQH